MFFYRALDEYPNVKEKFGEDSWEYKYFCESERWEIRLNIPWDDRDYLVDKLNERSWNIDFDFYSES